MDEIYLEHRNLENMKKSLDNRCREIGVYWDMELKRTNKQIFQTSLKEEDISHLKHKKQIQGTQNNALIGNLREILKSRATQPDHVINVLQLFVEERDKARQISLKSDSKKVARIGAHKMSLIRKEFELSGADRAISVLVALTKHLTFFMRFTEQECRMIYTMASFRNFQARTTIFNQGDEGDNMYVILKGSVAVEIKSPDIGNLPIIVALLKDGEHFGELGLIKMEDSKGG